MIGNIAFGVFGLAVLISFAYTVSSNKKSIDWKQISAGVALQIVFAVIVILVPGGREFFDFISRVFVKIIDFAMSGAEFIFGDLAKQSEFGFIFAFQVLPTIIFLASLMSVLYHIGLMQKIVQSMAWVMQKVLRVSGSESLSVAANVFIQCIYWPDRGAIGGAALYCKNDGIRTIYHDGRRNGHHCRRRAGGLYRHARWCG